MRSSTCCLLTASAILCLAVSLAPYDQLEPVYEITKWSFYPEVCNHVFMIAGRGHQILQRLVHAAKLSAINPPGGSYGVCVSNPVLVLGPIARQGIRTFGLLTLQS